MRFQACHGVLAHESLVPQPFEVDIEIACDLSVAEKTDRVEDTVNYAEVTDLVRQIMEGPPVALIERLAGAIADRVLALPKVDQVRVRVRKMAPPVGVSNAYAEVELVRGS